MDVDCLNYCLTKKEHLEFQQKGILLIENVLSAKMIKDLTIVVDRLDSQFRADKGMGPHDRLQQTDFVGKDEIFLNLIDWPKTFPKV